MPKQSTPAADVAAFSEYYETTRHRLLELLDAKPVPQRVLEIGCGGGANLAELKRRFPGIHTSGVEIHQIAANSARQPGRADALWVGDVLDAHAVNFDAASFDLIILSHVLEHFAEPQRVIDRCKQWLQPDGRMLIALPNVRHAVVIRQLLLQGDFRYEPAGGILDQTHLRFFTRSSALRFLASQGFRAVKVQADIEGGPSRMLDRLSFGLAREFAAFAYNFLVVRA